MLQQTNRARVPARVPAPVPVPSQTSGQRMAVEPSNARGSAGRTEFCHHCIDLLVCSLAFFGHLLTSHVLSGLPPRFHASGSSSEEKDAKAKEKQDTKEKESKAKGGSSKSKQKEKNEKDKKEKEKKEKKCKATESDAEEMIKDKQSDDDNDDESQSKSMKRPSAKTNTGRCQLSFSGHTYCCKYCMFDTCRRNFTLQKASCSESQSASEEGQD